MNYYKKYFDNITDIIKLPFNKIRDNYITDNDINKNPFYNNKNIIPDKKFELILVIIINLISYYIHCLSYRNIQIKIIIKIIN